MFSTRLVEEEDPRNNYNRESSALKKKKTKLKKRVAFSAILDTCIQFTENSTCLICNLSPCFLN